MKELKTKKVKNKLIKLFAVVDADDINSEGVCDFRTTKKFYTITDNYDECDEYIYTREIADHMEHYVMWCQQRNLNPSDDANWDSYAEIVLGDNSDYGIITFQIAWEDLIAFIRMFQGCYPIGCSFDRKVETEYFKTQLTSYLKDNSSLKDELDKEIEAYEELFGVKKKNPEDIIQ